VATSALLAADGPEWRHRQRLMAFDREPGDSFGRSVAVDGDTIAVGAEHDDDASKNSGSAYVFTRRQGEWAETQRLLPCVTCPGQGFGWSVGFSGTRLVVAAPWYSTGSVWRAGCAYLYRLSAGSSIPSCLLTANAAAPSEMLGEISIFGHTAVLGARLADVDDRPDAGAAYVFLLP